MATVAALKVVDGVFRQRASLAEIIETATPKYLVKGKDWAGRLPSDVRRACAIAGTVIQFTDTEQRHTSEARR